MLHCHFVQAVEITVHICYLPHVSVGCATVNELICHFYISAAAVIVCHCAVVLLLSYLLTCHLLLLLLTTVCSPHYGSVS